MVKSYRACMKMESTFIAINCFNLTLMVAYQLFNEAMVKLQTQIVHTELALRNYCKFLYN